MKKLRRNWSLKKSDISKSWSRIRKYSSPSMMPPIRPAFPITITQTNTLRRKPSRRSTSTTGSSGIGQVTIPDTKSVVRHHGGPVVGDGSNNDTTFYITLTIEQDDDDDDPLERIDSEWFTEFSLKYYFLFFFLQYLFALPVSINGHKSIYTWILAKFMFGDQRKIG